MKRIFSFAFLLFFLSSKSQIITTIAGNGIAGYSGNNGQSILAQLNNPGNVTVDSWGNLPTGITIDKAGNLYIADQFNFRIRKVDTAKKITTIAELVWLASAETEEVPLLLKLIT